MATAPIALGIIEMDYQTARAYALDPNGYWRPIEAEIRRIRADERLLHELDYAAIRRRDEEEGRIN